MRYDPDDRDDMIAAAIANYENGSWSRLRVEPVLRACGFNATEIEDFFTEHHRENEK